MRKSVVIIPSSLRRPNLLERALYSVARQSRAADLVLIACDAPKDSNLVADVGTLCSAFEGTLEVIVNPHAPGLSNTLNFAFRHLEDLIPDSAIISLLDDDDYWSPNYLEAVEAQFNVGADFVAAPFLYPGEDAPYRPARRPPNSIEPDLFLVGNPGISNSTMSICFGVLRKIGGWNDALSSCTDRDACLRLCRAGARYRVAVGATAFIDRTHHTPRLTDRGGAAKFDGLEAFYDQWRDAMSPEVLAASRARAIKLFDYDPGLKSNTAVEPLVIATMSVNPILLERLLISLDRHAAIRFDVTVIALRNNPTETWPSSAAQGLKIRYFSPPSAQGILKIAEARIFLQEKVRAYVESRSAPPPVWFLDDDFTVDDNAITKLGQAISDPERDADAILGQYVGDSPNAALSGLLFELQDLKANLDWLDELPADACLPDRSAENQAWMAEFADTYHYALSLDRRPDRIAWLEPRAEMNTVALAREWLLSNLDRLSKGNSLFRALRCLGASTDLKLGGASVHRGGTIVIFNPEMLKVPFPIIDGPNGSVRRSDMMWALLATHKFGFTIRRSNLETLHRRVQGNSAELGLGKTLDELIGSCVFNSLRHSFCDPGSPDFANALHARATATIGRLARYFDEIDMALAALDHFELTEISKLTRSLRELLDDNFRSDLTKGLIALTHPETASSIAEQFEAYTQSNVAPNPSCQLIRPRSRMTLSSHFNDTIQLLQLGDLAGAKRPLIRLHSSCQFSEVFGATDCDCADQLEAAMTEIELRGCGAIFYLAQEGRGHGLRDKIRIVDRMREARETTYEACDALGLAHDTRTYNHAAALLRELGVQRLCLLGNNPSKSQALRDHGFDVVERRLRGMISFENFDYLASKKAHGHRGLLLRPEGLDVPGIDKTDPVVIDSTRGPFGELSNFAPVPIFSEGLIWRSSEHLYQACKFATPDLRDHIRRASTPGEAKAIAREHRDQIIPDWEDRRLSVMYSTIKLKLKQNPEFQESLVSTGLREIIERSSTDSFWGQLPDGRGDNCFGKVLMLLRSELTLTETTQNTQRTAPQLESV
ncbi:NADAR domain-containing protein [Marivita sp.]|uniref:NADAR domain-containing protein n=1 Tax=Marivita sp. TaxID=2003365 RepID=UPI00321C1307